MIFLHNNTVSSKLSKQLILEQYVPTLSNDVSLNDIINDLSILDKIKGNVWCLSDSILDLIYSDGEFLIDFDNLYIISNKEVELDIDKYGKTVTCLSSNVPSCYVIFKYAKTLLMNNMKGYYWLDNLDIFMNDFRQNSIVDNVWSLPVRFAKLLCHADTVNGSLASYIYYYESGMLTKDLPKVLENDILIRYEGILDISTSEEYIGDNPIYCIGDKECPEALVFIQPTVKAIRKGNILFLEESLVEDKERWEVYEPLSYAKKFYFTET